MLLLSFLRSKGSLGHLPRGYEGIFPGGKNRPPRQTLVLAFPASKRGTLWQDLMVHAGFQQLYEETPEGKESPKTTIRRLVEEHKETLDKITCVGHSLGGGEFSTPGEIIWIKTWLAKSPLTL